MGRNCISCTGKARRAHVGKSLRAAACFCVQCYVFPDVAVKILHVLLDCVCSASRCGAIYWSVVQVCDVCAKLMKRKLSGSTCSFPAPFCSHFLYFFLDFRKNLVHLDTVCIRVVLILMETGCHRITER